MILTSLCLIEEDGGLMDVGSYGTRLRHAPLLLEVHISDLCGSDIYIILRLDVDYGAQ